MMRLWSLLVLVLIMLPSLARGQQFHQLWEFEDSYQPSDYSAAAFIKNECTVFVRSSMGEIPRIPNPQTVECIDSLGNSVWTYQLPDSEWSARSILATTDGFIYINFGYCILALTQDGQFVWRQNIQPDFNMREMRLFGDKLFVAGEDRSVPLQWKAIYFALDRHTGSSIYNRVLNNGQFGELKATVSHAYFRYDQPSNGSVVAKIDPENGNVVGQYEESVLRITRLTVDSQGMLYVGFNNGSSNWTLRKVNGSGTGSFPVIYSRTLPMSAGPICLSKGSLYTISYNGGAVNSVFFKINPTTGADVFSVAMSSWYETPVSMLSDKFGRLYVHWRWFFPNNSSTSVWSIDPATGNKLHTLWISSAGDPFPPDPSSSISFALNANAEMFFACGRENKYGVVARHFQTMEPQPDVYSVNAGETLSTNGDGVTANDRYVNTALTAVSLVTPPALGTLTLESNGEFTYDATGVPPGTQSFTYRLDRQSQTATQTATIAVQHGPFSLTLAKYVIAGQNSTLGTVRVSSPGPAQVVLLSDNSSLVSTPPSVTIPADQTSAAFRVQVQAVIATLNTTVFATLGALTRSVPLQLTPLVPTAMQFIPSSTVTGGAIVSCRVVINGVAGPDGRVLSIFDDSSFCQTPSQVMVPAGATSVTFEISTRRPPSLQVAKVTAAVSAGNCTATLRIVP